MGKIGKISIKKIVFQNLANLVTVVGLLATVWLLLVALTNPQELWLILILAGVVVLSDILDGWIARKLNIQSISGQIIDPLRDKVFICSLLIIFTLSWSTLQFNIPFILKTLTETLVILTILINILVCLMGLVYLIKKIDISPNQSGRRKTTCQFGAVMIWLISLGIETYLDFRLIKFSIYLIDIILLISLYLGIKSMENYWQRYSKGLS